MEIREIAPGEAAAAAELESEALPAKAWSERQISEACLMDGVKYLAAFEQGELVGAVSVYAACGEIMNLSVAAGKRKRGFGGALLSAALLAAAQAGAESVLLEVRADNTAAISLYEKYGFAQVGRRKALHGAEAYIIEKKL